MSSGRTSVGHRARLRLHLGRERVGQPVLGHHDLEVDARVLEAPEHVRAPGRPGCGWRSGGRVISAETISPGLRAAVRRRGDEQLVQDAAVEGDHVAAERPVVLVAAHDALQRRARGRG